MGFTGTLGRPIGCQIGQLYSQTGSNKADLALFLYILGHPRRMSSADGYVGSSASSELVDLIDLHVLCLNGEGCSLSLCPSTLGLEVRKAVNNFRPRKGQSWSSTTFLHR